MEVAFCVPLGADVSVVKAAYPDLSEDEGWDDHQRYFIGQSEDDYEDGDEDFVGWMSYDEAVEFCGFAEAAVEGSNCLIEGNGPWAQGMLERRDFSTMAISEEEKEERVRRSNLWWEGHRKGKLAASPPTPETVLPPQPADQ